MQDAKAVEFFEGVLAKTTAGRIRWEPTAKESEFIAAIGGKFTIAISRYWNDDFPFPRHALILKDQDGRELTRQASADGGIDEEAIRELYETARRQALHVDEKIDSILGELSKL